MKKKKKNLSKVRDKRAFEMTNIFNAHCRHVFSSACFARRVDDADNLIESEARVRVTA